MEVNFPSTKWLFFFFNHCMWYYLRKKITTFELPNPEACWYRRCQQASLPGSEGESASPGVSALPWAALFSYMAVTAPRSLLTLSPLCGQGAAHWEPPQQGPARPVSLATPRGSFRVVSPFQLLDAELGSTRALSPLHCLTWCVKEHGLLGVGMSSQETLIWKQLPRSS